MNMVSFRLDEALHARLTDLAGQRTGLSANTLAREIVTEFLEDGERERLLTEIREVKTQIRQLHNDQLASVFTLLLKAGKVADPNEAKEWISKALVGPAMEDTK